MCEGRFFLLCLRIGAISEETVAGAELFNGEEVLMGLGFTGNGVTKSKFSVGSGKNCLGV
jgi:hypothetical protein